MPAIHVMYDPRDLIQQMKSEDLKQIGASAASMTLNTVEVETETIQQTAEQLAVLLLNAIARDQE